LPSSALEEAFVVSKRTPFVALLAVGSLVVAAAVPVVAKTPAYDISTLAGKVASVNGTAGLQIRMSAFLQEEAGSADTAAAHAPAAPITPSYVLSSPLDASTVGSPGVTVNQDTAGAPQNETAIAVDPNNPNRVVAAANDYVARTWACDVSGTPCSALGDGYSGTYVSNDGGQTWCCTSTDPSHLGTLIPGVNKLAGGQYDAGGDPALAFDSQGNVYYAGLGFDRTAPPNTVEVNKGTFDGSGNLTWGQPTFINPTTAPSILNDKEWIAADSNASSPYANRVYVTWTRFVFNPHNGAYVQSPIFFAFSTDGGKHLSSPVNISANVHYSQGSRPVVGPDGTLYVFWDGQTRLAALDSTYMAKSTDGGHSWSKPVAVAPLVDIAPLNHTGFRVNSFPAAAVGPNGDLYVAWTSEVKNSDTTYHARTSCADYYGNAVYPDCHAAVVYSKSTDGGATWSSPDFAFPTLNASTQAAVGYPVTQPSDGTQLNAPAAAPVETLWPGVAVAPNGTVYMSAYGADVVSPWQTCATPDTGSAGRINCLALGDYIHNARLDYYVTNIGSGNLAKVTATPINTRNGFGGGFIGDYTDLAVGSDNVYHAFWTDTNNKQDVVWFYGYQFVPTPINQEDVVTASGTIN
jgi:hypothetical protein